ncbi:MAG: polyprenyl synthetase family protein [Thermoplasmatota archaeon]
MNVIEELEKRRVIVDKKIESVFEGSKKHPLWDSMSYYPKAGGKKLRPFLAMISAGALGAEEEKALPYGVAIELVHNFTLVHDDIMDDDEMRRGQKTLHKKIGDAQAINAGDGLFALSFKILSETDVPGESIRKLLEELSSSVVVVAEGQEEDMSFEETFDINEEEFITMIEKKTSYLFKAATRGGAIIADADHNEIEHMSEYARKMGIAFQIQDDYLDLVGDQEEIGKDVGSDIKSGKRTLMVIHAIHSLDEDKKNRLIHILEKNDNSIDEIEEAMELMKSVGSIDHAKNMAEKYGIEAKKELEFLPKSEYKEILISLVDFMINRNK